MTLGACNEDRRIPMVALTDSCKADSSACVTSDSYTCDELGGQMESATAWIGIVGTLMMIILLAYK